MATPQGDGSIILTTKVVTAGIEKGVAAIKSKLKTATIAVAAFGAATGYLVKQSVQAYAEYEQLVGGVETLFKNSADKVMKYASEAYKTAGMSANEYMANVTSFSASLLSSLEGDTDKAAEVANAALISISDNANKMGTNMESVTMAFQGFAKQQYMLLDNLKLGYGGTKTEMERLLKDAQAITGVEYNIDNLADVYTAIGVIQEKLGIAGTTALEAEKTISGSAATMKAAWQNALTAISGGGDLDSAIENLVVSVSNYFNNIVPVVEKALIGIGVLLEKIAPRLVETVASAFIKALPKLISAVGKMIMGLFQGIKLALAELLSGSSIEIVEEQSEKTKEAADNQEELTENIKETNKELKKSLAGFDEINVLTKQQEEATDSIEAPSAFDVSAPEMNVTFDGSPIEQEIDETFLNIMGTVSKYMIALGCVLLITGNIGWGIGLIIAGAIGSEYQEAQVGDGSSLKELIDTITNVLIIAGIIAIVLGILLCMASMFGVGIKLISIGAIAVVGSVALNWNSIKEKLQGSFGGWLAIGGIVAIILGILLCFTPALPLGIGLIALGAAAVVAPIVANWGAISNKIIEIFKEFAGIIAAAGVALIVLGIILCCTGVGIGLGIGLIVAGAAGLAIVVAVNWNAISEKILYVFREFAGIIAAAGAALIVLGIILCCTGVGIGLGIGLIVAGAAAIAGVVAVNWDTIKEKVSSAFNKVIEWVKNYGLLVLGILLCLTGAGIALGISLIVKWAKDGAEKGVPLANAIVSKVKEVWGKVKEFWNTNIAPVFTTKWWMNLGKNCINGLIAGFEGGINGIIKAFESMINWIVDGLNKLSFDFPEWLGGGTFGINLPRANFGKISIPRLATGAVIPPNREFLAVLGDQKRGTNIEAPLSTIQEAVYNVISGQNDGMKNLMFSSVEVQREILEAILGIQIGDDVIGQAANRYNRKQTVIHGG